MDWLTARRSSLKRRRGKTSVSRRLARDHGRPFSGSDNIARTIADSAGLKDGDAYWLAYDVAFALAEEWLSLGVSAVLDIDLVRCACGRASDRRGDLISSINLLGVNQRLRILAGGGGARGAQCQ